MTIRQYIIQPLLPKIVRTLRVLCVILGLMVFNPFIGLAQKDNRLADEANREAERMLNQVMNHSIRDSVALYHNVVRGVEASLRCDSLDRIPNRNHVIKPRFEDENRVRLLELHPLLINAGEYFARNKYYDDGVKALKLYLKHRNHALLQGEEDESGVALYDLSTIYYKIRNFHQADYYADQALEYDDVAQYAAEMKARCMHEMLMTREDSVRYELVLRKLYETEPTNRTYFAWMMQFYDHPSQHKQLEKFIQSQLVGNPGSTMPWILKGEMAMTDKRWADAIEAYKRADAIDATSIPVIYNIGVCLNNLAVETIQKIGKPFKEMTGENRSQVEEYLVEAQRYLERVRTMDPRRNKVNWVGPLYMDYELLDDQVKANELEPLVSKFH